MVGLKKLYNLVVIFTAIFLLELLLLFLLSKALIGSLARLIFHLTKSRQAVIYTLATLFLPGTIIHELAHAITAGVLMVQVGEVEFTPQIHEKGVKLGSAQVGKTDPLRQAVIGSAPVIVGLGMILGSLVYLSSSILSGQSYSWWVYLLVFYLIFTIGNTMFSSSKDLAGVVAGLILVVSILIALYLLGFREFFIWFNLILQKSATFFQRASLFLLIPLGLDLVVLLITKLATPKFDNF